LDIIIHPRIRHLLGGDLGGTILLDAPDPSAGGRVDRHNGTGSNLTPRNYSSVVRFTRLRRLEAIPKEAA